jgi:maleate cis-trans isomerase
MSVKVEIRPRRVEQCRLRDFNERTCMPFSDASSRSKLASCGDTRHARGWSTATSREEIQGMTHHFGVLFPSTNTTVEAELARLPLGYQAHYARLLSNTPGRPFAASRNEDIDYQSKLLGTAKVEMLILIQTSASVFEDDYDEKVMRRMSAAAGGVPAITSAYAMGRALRALGAKRIGLVSPYSEEVNARTRRYFSSKHGLEIAALEGFAASDSYSIGRLGPENARDAFTRIDRPEIDAFAVPGANFATMGSIPAWEVEFNKPVVSSTQAALWAMMRQLGGEAAPGFGRLLEQMPSG